MGLEGADAEDREVAMDEGDQVEVKSFSSRLKPF
jgi:hypothetical protein